VALSALNSTYQPPFCIAHGIGHPLLSIPVTQAPKNKICRTLTAPAATPCRCCRRSSVSRSSSWRTRRQSMMRPVCCRIAKAVLHCCAL